jgi:hypothetical protein
MMRLHLVGGVIGSAALLLGPQWASATRSIAACDPQTGECGMAAVSFPPALGDIVPNGVIGVVVELIRFCGVHPTVGRGFPDAPFQAAVPC